MTMTLMLAAMLAGASAPLIGNWHSVDSQLTLTADGGTLTLACTDLTLEPPVHMRRGGFDATALQVVTGGGPQPEVPPPASRVAVRGDLRGDTMTVRVTKPGQPADRYRLVRAGRVKFVRCL